MDTTTEVATRIWDKKQEDLTVGDNLKVAAAGMVVITAIIMAPYAAVLAVVGIKEACARRKAKKAKKAEVVQITKTEPSMN